MNKRFKKLFSVLMILTMLFAVNGVSFADGETENAYPVVQTLYAGQDIEVGTVTVENDEDTLTVTYETKDGWLMTETHLAVEASEGDIPQNKKGNPIPGHFENSNTHDPGVDTFTYSVTMDNSKEVLYIAAHAAVERTDVNYECRETVWMIGYVETYDCYGNLTNYADEFNWGEPAGPCEKGLNLSDYRPEFDNPYVVGTSIWGVFPYNANDNKDYATDFDVQWDGCLLYGGWLTLSWSPGNSALETKVVSGDGITEETFTAQGEAVTGKNWFDNQYKLVENELDIGALDEGTHSINFKHTTGDGTFWDWIKMERPCVEVEHESAWADGTRFVDKGNWATYFVYTPAEWVFVENVNVPSENGDGVTTDEILENGETYELRASGTFDYSSDSYDEADAEWFEKSSGWIKGEESPYDSNPHILDVSIQGAPENDDWGDYNSEHDYTMEYIGMGSTLHFFIYDTYYGDNSGSITVEIYRWGY